jgi:4-alpha-glucanotransferase
MADPELARRALAAGVLPRYLNWRDELVDVGAQTLAAVLAALGDGAEPGPREPASRRAAARKRAAARPGSRGEPRLPDRRCWGFTIQLYALRSRQSWGLGDLRDLADFAAWSGGALGADFVQVNPLNAAEPLPPVTPSPYLPMTRRYLSPLYLRISDIPEFGRLGSEQAARVGQLARPLLASAATTGLIDRDAVWSAKREALTLIAGVPLSARRQGEYARFRVREGEELARWAAWCALAEVHGPDWRTWPAALRDSRAALRSTARGPLARRAAFHAWLQWLTGQQLAAAQRAALRSGMRTGIVTDLPVGSHPGGADAWANRDLLVQGLTVGAPPDGFNQLGQDWGLPAWDPGQLAALRYQPLSALFRAAFRHCGGLRIDHVMALQRLWCIPAGMTPDRGAYLRYDQAAGIAALAGAAARARGVAIGEDLGTVDHAFRDELAAAGILGTTMIWFAHEPDGTPLLPAHWRRRCLATVGTHDMPTVAGFLSGEQVSVRARLGLLNRPEAEERAATSAMLSQWLGVLAGEGLIGPGQAAGPAEVTVALHRLLAATPAALIGVSLADAVGEVRAQNIPGTTDGYPNWRIPLCDGEGRPVLLGDLDSLPLLRSVADAVSAPRGP